MNDELRKAINVKNMFKRKYDKCKSSVNWKMYRKHRNNVNKLRKKCLQKHIADKCENMNVEHGKDFWKTIKPLLSDKCKVGSENITLLENDCIVNDPIEVGNILNDYYINVTKDIGPNDAVNDRNTLKDIIEPHMSNKSVMFIKDHFSKDNFSFSFKPVTPEIVLKLLQNVQPNKATGCDTIPPKMVKLAAEQLHIPITHLVNKCIEFSKFPDDLKFAEVTPIFKKDNKLHKKNYRPVSVLQTLSKIFESVLINQLLDYFETNQILSSNMSGFRKSYSCQSVLLKYVEDCKQALDNDEICGSILTDLSKAFDCLPHRLLIAKLSAYGVCNKSCMLMANYFQGRSQCVKLGNNKSEQLQLDKGAPQGSYMGPFVYNLFSNDLLLLVQSLCNIYNYADDNTVSCTGKTTDDVINKLKNISNILINWFQNNYMKANPEKFQFIMYSKTNEAKSILINDTVVNSETSVKLLGVHIDSRLNFNNHITHICKKAGKQINALARLSTTLSMEVKYRVFETFILSHFNFCPIVWHFCSAEDLKRIENVQKRALRFVLNDFNSSYSDLRKQCNRSLLYVHRLRLMAIEVFKMYHNIGPTYLYDLIEKKNNPYNLRMEKPVVLPTFNSVTYGFNSFKYQGSYMWNSLPNEMKQSADLKSFKYLVNDWQGFNCTCSSCKLCILKRM